MRTAKPCEPAERQARIEVGNAILVWADHLRRDEVDKLIARVDEFQPYRLDKLIKALAENDATGRPILDHPDPIIALGLLEPDLQPWITQLTWEASQREPGDENDPEPLPMVDYESDREIPAAENGNPPPADGKPPPFEVGDLVHCHDYENRGIVRQLGARSALIEWVNKETGEEGEGWLPFSAITLIKRAKSMSLGLLKVDAIEQMAPTEFLIDKILPCTGNAVPYGPPEVGKSFLALDWALSIAAGLDSWHGHAILPGEAGDRRRTVLYIYAEGASGLNPRIRAWRKAHPDEEFSCNRDLSKFYAIVQRPKLPPDLGLVLKACDELGEKPVLVVIDTLSRCIHGSESNDKDMPAFIEACDAIREHTGALIMPIHHVPKKDQSTPRGHSSLMGAADVLLKIDGEGDQFTVTCEKAKDVPRFEPITLARTPVEVGIFYKDGSPVSSCYLVKAEPGAAGAADTISLAVNAKRALLALKDSEEPGVGMTWTQWLKASGITNRTTFSTVAKILTQQGTVEHHEKKYRTTAAVSVSVSVSNGIK